MKIMQQTSHDWKFNYKNSEGKKKLLFLFVFFSFFSKPVKASFFNMFQHTGRKKKKKPVRTALKC